MQKYFLGLKKTLPSMSPIDKSWPSRSYLFLEGTHEELRKIFHLWRVSPLIQSTPTFFYLENIDLAIRAAPKTKHKMFLTFIFIIRSANVSVNLQMSHVIRVCTSWKHHFLSVVHMHAFCITSTGRHWLVQQGGM